MTVAALIHCRAGSSVEGRLINDASIGSRTGITMVVTLARHLHVGGSDPPSPECEQSPRALVYGPIYADRSICLPSHAAAIIELDRLS